jgi:hypothetical protein
MHPSGCECLLILENIQFCPGNILIVCNFVVFSFEHIPNCMLNDLNKFFPALSASRLFLTSLAVITAYWYLTIFLFDRDLISDERFYVPFVLSFCLSFAWNLVTIVLSFSLFKKPQHPNQRLYPEHEHAADQDWGQKCFFWNVIVSVIILSAFTLLQFFLQLSFNTYVLTAFTIVALVTAIRVYLQNKVPKAS